MNTQPNPEEFEKNLTKNQQGLRNAMALIGIHTAHEAWAADIGLHERSTSQTLEQEEHEEFFQYWIKLADALNDEITLKAIGNASEDTYPR